jgi:tRNA (adenine57-N1/adenine58-N1)-methyltransferase
MLVSYFLFPSLNSCVREEFARHGMSDVVTLVHRNVCKEGFTVVDTVDSGKLSYKQVYVHMNNCQAFLDLPAPWDAVEYAKKALRVRTILIERESH